MNVPVPRAELARRAAALQALRGGRSARWLAPAGPPGKAGIAIAAVLAAPEWLCLSRPELERLARLMATLCWAASLADSIDGRSLDALAEAAGRDDADWALEVCADADIGTDGFAGIVSGWAGGVAWTGERLGHAGRGLQSTLLSAAAASASLAGLLDTGDDRSGAPLPVALAVIGPALARLRSGGARP